LRHQNWWFATGMVAASAPFFKLRLRKYVKNKTVNTVILCARRPASFHFILFSDTRASARTRLPTVSVTAFCALFPPVVIIVACDRAGDSAYPAHEFGMAPIPNSLYPTIKSGFQTSI
jgi:hypothetical protein